MHKISLIGRLTKDAVHRFTADGKQVADISLAVDDGFGDNKKTLWIRASLWGERAEKLTQYLLKGTQVYIEGRLNHAEGNPKIFTRQDGTAGASFEVFVTDLTLLGGKKQEEDTAF
jgi:single-strand DNA-binding protein